MSSLLYLLTPWTTLALRLALAAIFFVHGPPKMKMNHQLAPKMGMTPEAVWSVGVAETVVAVSMLIGLLTQISAIAIVGLMLGAIYCKMMKWHVPFTAMDKTGWEFDLVILCAALVLITNGAGSISVDWSIFGIY